MIINKEDEKLKRKALKLIEEKQVDKNEMDDKIGISKLPLCTEPWESFYILRRGVLPCCYGNQSFSDMSDWEKAWNSPKLQEIRRYLSQGKLSLYCLESPNCPIVQRYLEDKAKKSIWAFFFIKKKHPFFRLLNRLLFRIPGKIFRGIIKNGV